MMIVTYQDAKELNYCNKGLRQFCDTLKIDYQDFKANGIDSELLLSFDDAQCTDLVNHAMNKAKGQQV